MKRVRGAYGIAALLSVLALILVVTVFMNKSISRFFGMEGFQSRTLDCKGITCEEGQFCQDNVCKAISPPYTNNYFPTQTA